MVPFKNSTSFLVIANPSPLPFDLLSSSPPWVNLSNMLCCSFLVIPLPVSLIITLSSTFSSLLLCNSACNFISPLSVNLLALVNIFSKIWVIIKSSLNTNLIGLCGYSNNTFTADFLCCILIVFSSPFNNRTISSSFILASIFPASILEISRILVTSLNNISVLLCTTSRYSCCSAFTVVSCSRYVMPAIALSGVRISWLILAKNSCSAAWAFSATSLAALSCVCNNFWSVISR